MMTRDGTGRKASCGYRKELLSSSVEPMQSFGFLLRLGARALCPCPVVILVSRIKSEKKRGRGGLLQDDAEKRRGAKHHHKP